MRSFASDFLRFTYGFVRFHIATTVTSGYYLCINLNNLHMNNLITTTLNIVYTIGFVSILTFTIVTIINN